MMHENPTATQHSLRFTLHFKILYFLHYNNFNILL